MAKGEGVQYPMCKLCGEAHRIERGMVCPKFRSKKTVEQPKLKQIEAPKKAKP